MLPPSGAGGLYYYHPDHLGTSTALTDFNGNAYQFFLNLPFGETMAQQLGSNYYYSPYKFNGKELDEETGFYYYGARYYDPKISIWLSVDPLAEKFPNFNPYNYVMQNPLNLIDPTGMSPEEGGGDPKKNVILVIDSEKALESFRNAYSNNPKEGWNVIFDTTINGAKKQLDSQGYGTGSITNLVIRSHANQDELLIGGEYLDTPDDERGPKSFTQSTMREYNINPQSEKLNQEQLDSHLSFKSIGNYMEAGGNLIFTGCNVGSSPKIPEAVYNLLYGKNLNFYYNTQLGGLNLTNVNDSIKCNNKVVCPNSENSKILQISSDGSKRYINDLIINSNSSKPFSIIK